MSRTSISRWLRERPCLTSLHGKTYTRRRLMIESPIRTPLDNQVARLTEEIDAIG